MGTIVQAESYVQLGGRLALGCPGHVSLIATDFEYRLDVRIIYTGTSDSISWQQAANLVPSRDLTVIAIE